MDLVRHMNFPLVVHVVDSSSRVVGLLVDRLEQFSRLLLILVGDVLVVVVLAEHLELVLSNLLVVVSVCSPKFTVIHDLFTVYYDLKTF